jgi:hypothetical protein
MLNYFDLFYLMLIDFKFIYFASYNFFTDNRERKKNQANFQYLFMKYVNK